jgi:hypothetical protein
MAHLKIRLFALLLILVSGGLAYYNWYELRTAGTYSFKIATFAPVCVVGGIFLLLFPTKVGKPDTTREKILVFAVLGLGLIAGLVNWYLMDPGRFGGGK